MPLDSPGCSSRVLKTPETYDDSVARNVPADRANEIAERMRAGQVLRELRTQLRPTGTTINENTVAMWQADECVRTFGSQKGGDSTSVSSGSIMALVRLPDNVMHQKVIVSGPQPRQGSRTRYSDQN